MVCKKLVLKFFLLTGQPLHCQPNLNQHQRQVKLYKNGLNLSISYISISISDSSPVWAPLPELLLEFLGRSLISTSAASSNSPDGDQDDDDEGDEEEEEENDDDDCDHNNFESKILMRMTITFSFSCSLSRSAACLKSPFTCRDTMTKQISLGVPISSTCIQGWIWMMIFTSERRSDFLARSTYGW